MANPTTNYSFAMPTNTDLVKDLPADFEVFGQAVDTQMKTNADAAVVKSTFTTKGDLIAATGASTPARLGVGTNGQVLLADSTASTGLAWGTPAAGSLTLLSTTTLSGSGVTISSINQGYKNLRVRIKGAYTSATFRSYFMTFNNDSGSNYYAYGDWWTGGGEWTVSGSTSFPFYNQLTSSNTTISNVGLEMNIFDYAGNGAKDSTVNLISTVDGNKFLSGYSRWASTAAINRVDITTNGTFSGGSVEIWGIN